MGTRQKVRTFNDLLTDKQKMIQRVQIMGMKNEPALEELKRQDYNIGVRELQKVKKQIIKKREQFLFWMAKEGLEDLHLTSLQTVKMIEGEYWKLYQTANESIKKAAILDKIVALQPWISMYADATQDIIQKQLAGIKAAEGLIPEDLAKHPTT